MTDTKRDFAADLALCEKATEGPWDVEPQADTQPWFVSKYGGEGQTHYVVKTYYGQADAEFIAASREGWPIAIREAMRVGGLEAERDAVLSAAHDAEERRCDERGKKRMALADAADAAELRKCLRTTVEFLRAANLALRNSFFYKGMGGSDLSEAIASADALLAKEVKP